MRKTLAGLFVVAMVAGCTNYYKVTDPNSGKVYYTTELREKSGGAVQIKDASNGNDVTLQNHEVEKIDKEDFESGKAKASQLPAAASSNGAMKSSASVEAPAAAPAAPAAPAQENAFK
jgi:hypothetical protein